jgi:hypothetical protein
MGEMDATTFTDEENWHGGFYELAILLGDRDDVRLDAAIGAVWADPRVDGCYADRHREPADQERVPCTLEALDEVDHLRGIALLPDGQRVVCGTVIIREEESRMDWLDFYVPAGALARVDPRVGGYPFGGDKGGSLVWRTPIDDWLAEVAGRVYAAASFTYALIGFEASGEELPDAGTTERYIACVVPTDGRLEYIPANR